MRIEEISKQYKTSDSELAIESLRGTMPCYYIEIQHDGVYAKPYYNMTGQVFDMSEFNF